MKRLAGRHTMGRYVQICAVISVLVVITLLATPAKATVTDVVAVGATVGSCFLGTAVIFVGGGEIGYYIWVATTGGGDPPDLVNFDKKANPQLL